MANSRFHIPVGSSDIASLAIKDLFNNSIVISKDRTFTYKRWSEKATIVAYHDDIEAYDIVVTTITYAGTSAAVTKVNRTIRNVKSIVPPSVYIFKPSEIVLIGYISERRESPVILGLRAAKANKTVTYVGNDDSGQSCPLQIILRETGEDITNEEEVVVNCSDLYSTGDFDFGLEVKCGTIGGAWNWDVPDCTFTPEGENAWQIEESGINDRYATFSKTGEASGYPSSRPCMVRTTCIRYQETASQCSLLVTTTYYAADGTPITGLICSSSFGGSCTSCAGLGCAACNDPSLLAGSCPGCYHDLTSCDDPGDIPTIPGTSNSILTAYQLGNSGFEFDGPEMERVLTTGEIEDNMENGCCMCANTDRSIISYTDDDGNEFSVQLRVEQDDEYPLPPGLIRVNP